MAYRGKKRFGKPMQARPLPKDFVRFLEKVKINTVTGCWIWCGYRDKKGYGQFWYQGRSQWAHRWAKQAWHGAFQMGIQGNHECRNTSCVNPDHISGMTCSRNVAVGNMMRGIPVEISDNYLPPGECPVLPVFDDDIPF